MKIEAIVAAAGRGKRLNISFYKTESKPFIKIKKRPILYYTLKCFENNPLIEKIILVIRREDLKKAKNLVYKEDLKKIKKIITGGKTRRLSVERGLNLIDKDTELILIHDGVRPFINQHFIDKLISQAKRFGAAVLGVPLKSTIKEIKKNLFVKETLNRERIWEIQTPQVFKKDLILKAYKNFRGNSLDDAQLVERLGARVKLIRGSYFNIKITTPEDLIFAEAILKNPKITIQNLKF